LLAWVLLPSMKKTYQGSCHCGQVRFECELDLSGGSMRCNCSFCSKARAWLAFTKAADFRLLQGKDALSDYRHTPPKMQEPFLHLEFCRNCGVRAFSRGGALPQFDGPFYAVNLTCLDGVSDEELALVPIRYSDGRNDNWDVEAVHRFL
jgi:hypothetical protein